MLWTITKKLNIINGGIKMNWALEEAKKLIERYPDKEEYVIASGVSP